MDEIIAYLEQRGTLDPNESWEGYMSILCHIRDAQQRIPTLDKIKDFDRKAIDALFVREIEELAALVCEILPGGLGELEEYLPTARP